jgi:hypothetical protein
MACNDIGLGRNRIIVASVSAALKSVLNNRIIIDPE